ncbi:MAG: NADH:flavin oxidoreductase/NADH oxidase [Fastidiosipilaceae bacterium]|jgi:NADPH2 dehydrogenase
MDVFSTAKIGSMEVSNRIVMPPMCMYVAENDGKVNEFHLAHYAARALGGVGLIIVEATGISPEGRISANDLGLWSDDQVPGMKELVDRCHALGAKIAIQLGHAGRKCEVSDLEHVAPSAIDFAPDEYPLARAMDRDDIKKVVQDFVAAAKRADRAGFDGIEIHAAHGYLLHEFLSPLSNERTDEYGGATKGRVKLLREVVDGVRSVLSKDKPLWIRVSATDHSEGGLELEESVRIIDMVKDQLDAVHVSSGGLITVPIHLFNGYQVQYAERIRESSGLPVITVGLIDSFELVQNIVEDGRADFVALGRALLRDPFWFQRAAAGRKKYELIPEAYHRGWK